MQDQHRSAETRAIIAVVRESKEDTHKQIASVREFTNLHGQRGFLIEQQRRIVGQWFFETVFGYKIPWDNERKNRAMVAVRLTIKRYQKQEV